MSAPASPKPRQAATAKRAISYNPTLRRLPSAEVILSHLDEVRDLLERERKFKQQHYRRRKLRKLVSKHEQKSSLPDSSEVDFDLLADITGFDYRFQFREELSATIRHRLEIAAAKLEWKQRDGTPGFFANLVKNGIDWKSEISVVASVLKDWAEKVVCCGLWTKGRGHPKNSGRCHLLDHCRLCGWIDYGSILQSSLGAETDTFHLGIAGGLSWYAIHLSVRDCAGNARAVGRDIRDDDWDFLSEAGVFSGLYDPRPVTLHSEDGCDFGGVHTCRYVFLAAQSALKSTLPAGLLHGFRSKAETALTLMPLRGLPHVHAVANGPADDPQHLANELKASMDDLLAQHARRMQRPLYASVRVFRLLTPEDLERAALYLEKPIPLGELVKEVLARPEAKRPDGSWDDLFLERLHGELLDLYELARGLRSKHQSSRPELQGTARRCCRGNMRFGKGSLLADTERHRDYRLKKAQEQRDKRRQAKQRRKGRLVGKNPGPAGGVDLADAELEY